ncbi:hypothetical protein ASG74_11745, partial [Knoellia sp. Soil729]
LCQRHHTHVHDQRLIATTHLPDEHGRSVTWDTSPGSYDRALAHRLNAMARAQNERLARRRADTAGRLHAIDAATSRSRTVDTGPPDPWRQLDPDEDAYIDELIAWHDTAHEDLTPWPDPDDLIDASHAA